MKQPVAVHSDRGCFTLRTSTLIRNTTRHLLLHSSSPSLPLSSSSQSLVFAAFVRPIPFNNAIHNNILLSSHTTSVYIPLSWPARSVVSSPESLNATLLLSG